MLAVARPAEDLMVVAPARRQRPACRIPRELLRHAAGRRDDVHLFVAVVLAGECDPLPVGREPREQLETGVRRETRRGAARCSEPTTDRPRDRMRLGCRGCPGSEAVSFPRRPVLHCSTRRRRGMRASGWRLWTWRHSPVGAGRGSWKRARNRFRTAMGRGDLRGGGAGLCPACEGYVKGGGGNVAWGGTRLAG